MRSGNQLWLPWAEAAHRMDRRAIDPDLRKDELMSTIAGLSMTSYRPRFTGEARVSHHPLGRRTGCFDSIRWRRVVPWSGIRAEALAVLITASEPQFIHLLNGDMMPALLRFVIGIRVNISKLVCTKKLPVNSNYCYNVVKPLLYLLQMVCSNINLLVLVCIFKKGPYP